MLRKILSVVAVIVLGLLGFAPAASAAPAPNCYTPATLSLTSVGGLDLVIGGTNFWCESADSVVTIELVYDAPNGLRHSAAARALSDQVTAVPDENGDFSINYTALKAGTITAFAVGIDTAKAPSASIALGATGGSVIGGGTSDQNSGGIAYTGTGNGTGGLAYTGASIVGPVIIGIVALLAGLSLLFFGTRGISRRKHAGSSS